APDVALDADQIQIQIHASNGGTGGPLDTPLPFDSGYASSVHAHVLAPNGTIRLGQSSSNRGSFRGLHVLADIESTITFEGDVDGSFGSAPYFTSTDVTTANVGAEYEYDADAFDADVGDVLTYFLDRRPDWMDIDRNTGEIIWVPRSNQGGDHLVELRVEDLAGNTAVRTFTIVVPLTNQAPSGVADFYRAYEGLPRTLTPVPTLNDDDPDNDLLDFVLMTQPANGTVTIESNGDVTYTSNAAFVGTDSFEYRARDPGGLESANTTVSITVFEANDPPVCVDRVYTVDEDTLLDVASVMGLTVGSSDPESDPVSVFVVSPPAHGTLTVSVDGAFTFLPDVEQTQQVTFDFICHDGRAFAAAPSTATINITPLNDAPLVDAGPDRTEPLGTMVALAGDAFDAEGDVMTFAWTFASVPSGSTAVLTGADTPSPTFGTDELGTYNLTLTVTDANGAVDSDSVVITSAPLNRPPEIIEDPVPVARPGRAFNFPTNVNEPDGDTSLTYALVPEPSWLSPFSSTTGTLVGTPTANDLGSYPVTVTVTDPGGLSDTRSYTIEVVADAVPVAVDDTYDAFVDETLTVAAASGVLANDSDADNDALTASVVTPPSTGSLTLGSDGSLTYDFALVSSSAITEKYHAYSGTGVISTPMVAHLTDDNGDGDIDQDDIPAIVFVTRPGGQFSGGAIVAIRGTDGQVLFTAGGPSNIAALNEIAIGDIDGDGLVEIVAAHQDGEHLVAYEHTGAFKWQSTTDVLPGRRDSGGAISIANLDGTGLPEIVIGSSVYDANGTLLADGRDLGVSAVGYSFFTSISAVADIDLDGTPEIVAGPAAFRFSNGALSLVWHRSDRTDGFVAIGNFDDDPYAEIVINGGNLYILDHDGTDFAPWVTPPPSLGGAPTIADLDGDGDAEIGVLKGGTYRAYEADGTLMWSFVVNDGSVSTGSTVYDFDLDGAVEIVYRDERFLRVFRGSDGAVLTQIEVHNGTGTEQPVVADVDGDGFAELVVSADPLPSGSSSYDTGIHVFEGAPNEWAPTRSIWNQHSYHVTNVNDDGTIPLVEATNWLAPGLNNFRLNTLEPGTHTDSFTYRVNDGAQDSDVATVTITIRPPNTAPTITSDLPLTAYVGVPYVQPIAAFDPDPGDTVTWSAPDAPAFVSLLSTPDRLSFTATQAGSLMLTLRAQDALGAFSLRPYTFQVTTPQTVTVPDVVGLVQATAVGDVEALGLSTSVTSMPDAVVPAGSVVSQTPSAGASATQGDVVALVVSTGPVQINVPDVVGLVEATAASDIAAAGLTVGVTSQAPHPSIASGSVTTQTPSAGVVVDEGTAVDLVVSQGVVVPDVIGATDQAAVNSIAAAGLTTGVVQYVVALAVAGTVVTQVPAGGTPATANDPVELVLSLGPQYTTVPLVVGLLEQDATSAVVTADLVVGQIQTQASTAIPAGHIIASTPTGGTVVPDLTAVDLIVSSGAPSVVVPNVVGLTTSAAANTLLAAGLGGSFAGETHPTTPAGEVVRQTPVAGTSVAGGVVVSMFVSVGPASATVPNVVGLAQSTAVAAIAAASLTDAVTSVYHPTIPSGTVVTQSPAGGSVVADGSLVAIDVSQGPAPATVPNVVSLTVAAANSAVAAAGLVVASTYAADAAPVDTVVSQTPAGGATVNDGSVVDLVVSAGPNPQPLPHVVGFLEADAASRIVADGFAVGTVTQATSSSVPAGRVAAQTPPGGALRPGGSNVDLVVSSGPPVATVPNVVGLAELHAISELTTAGFTTGAIVAQHSNVTPYGLVSLQAPGAGVSVEQGSAVDLTISLGPEPDTTAPRVVVDIQPPFIVLGNAVTIAVTVTGETLPVTTEVAVNGVPQTVSSGTVTVTPSASGPHVVAVNVTDASGNETALTRYFGVDVAGDVTAPTASITTPANADVITEPTLVVGTATDANLLYYELSYRSASDDTFTTIVTSPLGVTADELGVFDPTLLENGLYTLRLEAVDVGGRTSSDEVSVHVDGNMKVGVFTLSFVDLAIPLTGIPISVTRTYDSRVKRTEDFGVGWSLDVAAGRYENNRPLSEGWSITQSAPPGAQACGNQDDLAQYRTTEIRLSDQEYYTFAPYIVAAYPSFGSCYVQVAFGATGGSAPGAVLGIVGNDFAVNPSGADYLLDDITGLPFEISRVRLTTYDGRTFDIDEDDGVVRMEDRNGNEVFVTSSGIIHENGRSVSFVRDAQRRITQIIDPMGETMHYVYDANDDLVSFTDRLGNTTTFEYGRDHYLEKIVDPRGVSAVRSEYDANGRLLATIDPDGNRIEVVHDLATRRETVTNRLGDTTYFDYDVRGNVVQETYPDSTFITRTFDL
ncbi:MAG: PASTA domain-containing protein, partial [Roseitalea porphyridii]